MKYYPESPASVNPISICVSAFSKIILLATFELNYLFNVTYFISLFLHAIDPEESNIFSWSICVLLPIDRDAICIRHSGKNMFLLYTHSYFAREHVFACSKRKRERYLSTLARSDEIRFFILLSYSTLFAFLFFSHLTRGFVSIGVHYLLLRWNTQRK